jgi:hypothetical protein
MCVGMEASVPIQFFSIKEISFASVKYPGGNVYEQKIKKKSHISNPYLAFCNPNSFDI